MTAQRQNQLRDPTLVTRLLHGDPPGAATGIEAVCPEFAGKLYHITFAAHCNQPFSYPVDHVAGGDTADIHLERPVLAQLLPAHMQILLPGALHCCSNGGRFRYPGFFIAMEAPES